MENNLKDLKMYIVQMNYLLPVAAKSDVEAREFAKKVLETERPNDTGLDTAQYIPCPIKEMADVPDKWSNCPIYNTEGIEGLKVKDVLHNQFCEVKKKHSLSLISDLIAKAKDNGYSISKSELIELINKDGNLV